MVILYSTGCPKCKVLEQKLRDKGIEFEVETDVEIMENKGFLMAPMLEVGEVIYDYNEALQWVSKQKGA